MERDTLKHHQTSANLFAFFDSSFLAGLLLLASFASTAHAIQYQNLPIVKPVVTCDQLAKAELAQAVGTTVTIKSATERDTEKGKYCKVTGTIAPAVNFEVDLPLDHWTQRYLEGGCGGMCGTVNATIGNAGSCMPALNGEFAVAGDDMGHSGGMGPGAGPMGSFGADPDARIDFAYRANHETTLAAKALIKAFYGQPQKFSYFVGCSDGGREALAEAERFPNDFDGISAGAPVLGISVHNSFFHGWEGVVDKRADGSLILLKPRLAIAHDAIIAHCPTLSGVQDGLLESPLACKFEPKELLCKAGDAADCLTTAQVDSLTKLSTGAVNPRTGENFYPGWPAATRQFPGPVLGQKQGAMPQQDALDTFRVLFQKADWDYHTMDFDKDIALSDKLGNGLMNAADETRLKPLFDRGGKILLYHGWSDPNITPLISIQYYNSAVAANGGLDKTYNEVRLFMVPGMGHCGGGDGPNSFDKVDPLADWVEHGKAPDVIIATHLDSSGHVDRTRPLCPYPQVAKYNGTGNINVAESFACSAP